MLKTVFATFMLMAGTTLSQTIVTVSPTARMEAPPRLGINLDDHAYYGADQIMKNLVMNNPGFEGQEYNSVIVCSVVTQNTCTDFNQYSVWPADYWHGATVEVIYNAGGLPITYRTTWVIGQTAANGSVGAKFTFANKIYLAPPGTDYFDKSTIILRRKTPSPFLKDGSLAGWWPNGHAPCAGLSGSSDVSSNSAGVQSLKITQTCSLTQYFDSGTPSALTINGPYKVTFRAKVVSGNPTITVGASRIGGSNILSDANVPLINDGAWHDYAIPFTGNETPNQSAGTAQLGFDFSVPANATLLFDDVSLHEDTDTAANPTVFRDAVVSILKTLHPGVLRYMGASTALGSSIKSLLAPEGGRLRGGFHAGKIDQESIPYGIDDFLLLCKVVGAEPYIVLPASTTVTDMRTLIIHLATTGPGYGEAWKYQFTKIHLELGNELWNAGTFPGEAMGWEAQASRTSAIFRAAKSLAGFYDFSKFDLIIGGWAAVSSNNDAMLAFRNTYADTITIAPYFLNSPVFGANDLWSVHYLNMIGEIEQYTSSSGWLGANKAVASNHNIQLGVYETNISGAGQGILTKEQAQGIANEGVGLATSAQMLASMDTLGVRTQAFFTLPQYNYGDWRIWGAVVDMGVTNRLRPQFLTLQLANQAIRGDLLTTSITGENPLFNVTNNSDDPGVNCTNCHFIQAHSFGDASGHQVVVYNLDPTNSRSIQLMDTAAIGQPTTVKQISADINVTNEVANNLKITPSANSVVGSAVTLPPHSMTVFSYELGKL